MDFIEIKNNYDEYLKDYHSKHENITLKIERLQKKLNKLENTYKSWVDGIVIPLALTLKERLNLEHFEIYGPFGCECETSIYLSNFGTHKKNDLESDIKICEVDTYSITLRPDLTYNTGKKTNTYPKGSIGELNGLNYIFENIPDKLEDIVKILTFSRKEENDE